MERNRSEDTTQAHRRALHRIPEIGDKLPETKAYVLSVLERLNCRIISVMESGLMAFFDKGKGSTVAFRADMDALPIQEKNNVAYRSTHDGQMHACGHDGHMAICLALAEHVDRADIPYNVLLLFQPAEESVSGAEHLVATGILKDTRTRAIFGYHLWPFLEQGAIATLPGAMMGMSAEISGKILGKKAHAANAEEGIDAIEVLVRVLADCYDMPKDGLLRVGKAVGGTAPNVLSDRVEFMGTMRSLREEGLAEMKAGVQSICRKWEEATGAVIEVSADVGCPPLINDSALYEKMLPFLQSREVLRLEKPVMTSEDFAYYGQAVPALFFFLGTGTGISLHSDVFDFEEKVLERGLEFFKEILELDLWKEAAG